MSFFDELFPECEAHAAYMRTRMEQERPAETARAAAWWGKATERQQEYVYDRVINGRSHASAATPADRGVWPAAPYVTADFQAIYDRVRHICEAD